MNHRADQSLRVSVATYNRVIFPHPHSGTTTLALERRATVLKDGSVNVRSQPFGGGVRIFDPISLTKMLGEIQFDGERSKQEGDFRILIPPSRWDVVKEYCLCHLTNPDDTELESTPDRELAEEFEETVHFELKPDQYKVQPTGFVIEDHPVHTANRYAYGQFTVRIYRVFEVRITDAQLCRILLDMSRQISDDELARRARQSDNNRTNTVLTLPLRAVKESYLALPPEARYRRIVVEGFELDESVLVTLEDVNVPQYERI